PEAGGPSGDLAGREGDVVLGVRPHDLLLNVESGGADLPVTLVEPLGSEQIVHLALPGGGELVAAGRWAVREGDTTSVRIPADAVHLFDPRTGERC
ncbi:MAG TPA: TOBE domain-containing protein, partial [Gemmatimonadaceae bacterium]